MTPKARRPSRYAPSSSSSGIKLSFLPLLVPDEDRRRFMLSDKVAWEKSWNKELKRLWDGPSSKLGKPSANFATGVSGREAEPYASVMLLDKIATMTNFCCKGQREFTAKVLSVAGHLGIEQEWRGLPDDVRRDVIFNGICLALDDPFLQTARRYCPDSTVEYLASNGGEPYLEAILALTQSSAATNTLWLFSHPAVDHYLQMLPSYEMEAGYKALAHTHHVIRAHCLLAVLEGIFDAFCIRVCGGGRMCECRDHHLAADPSRTRQDAERERCFKEVLTGTSTLDSSAVKKLLSQLCRVCSKGEDGAGHKLLCCKKCRAGGLSVYYCSRECQLQDWNHGRPRPHKQTCGRPLDEDVLTPATYESELSPCFNDILKSEDGRKLWSLLFPKPCDWFKYPLALRRQISFQQGLLEIRGVACIYAVFSDSTPNPIIIRLEDFPTNRLRIYFLAHRLCGGLPDSVFSLGVLIGYAIQLSGQSVPYADIVQQLEREYNLLSVLGVAEDIRKAMIEILYDEKGDESKIRSRVLEVMRTSELEIFDNPDGPSHIAVDEENVASDAVSSDAAESEPLAIGSSSRL